MKRLWLLGFFFLSGYGLTTFRASFFPCSWYCSRDVLIPMPFALVKLLYIAQASSAGGQAVTVVCRYHGIRSHDSLWP